MSRRSKPASSVASRIERLNLILPNEDLMANSHSETALTYTELAVWMALFAFSPSSGEASSHHRIVCVSNNSPLTSNAWRSIELYSRRTPREDHQAMVCLEHVPPPSIDLCRLRRRTPSLLLSARVWL